MGDSSVFCFLLEIPGMSNHEQMQQLVPQMCLRISQERAFVNMFPCFPPKILYHIEGEKYTATVFLFDAHPDAY